jgi:hypothetical protein
MNHLTADEGLLQWLAGLMEPVEIRDPSGKVLGRYTPVFVDEKDRQVRAEKYFDLAEAERVLAEKPQGFTLAEVWEQIRAQQNQG